jgi:hypothetical protein
MTTTAIDQSRLEAFLGQVIGDGGAALSVLLTHLGDKLGLYAAMADGKPVDASDLARRTGTNERMVHEWLCNQAAGGYVTYDRETGRFWLPPEQAFVLANESSPALMQGGFDSVAAAYQSIGKELSAFRTGTGLTWGDHHPTLFGAIERFFRLGYQAHLVQEWIPAMDGVHEKLTAGARVADVGCGYGASTVILASAYPDSTFTGYDYHEPSVRSARERASQARVSDRVSFQVANATDITGPHDLIAFFDCWHDTADPLGRHGGPAGAGRCRVGAARRAGRRRPDRGQPAPVRPDVLRRLGPHVRPVLGQRRRPRPRRAGRRGTRPRTVRQGRLQHLPPCRADPSERGLPGQRLGERHAGLVFPPDRPAQPATRQSTIRQEDYDRGSSRRQLQPRRSRTRTPAIGPVAVLGATGQVGRHVVTGLAQRGQEFTAAGTVRFDDASIARALACNGARINGQDTDGVALRAGGI